MITMPEMLLQDGDLSSLAFSDLVSIHHPCVPRQFSEQKHAAKKSKILLELVCRCTR